MTLAAALVQALDKKAENARELGLHYEPEGEMTKWNQQHTCALWSTDSTWVGLTATHTTGRNVKVAFNFDVKTLGE